MEEIKRFKSLQTCLGEIKKFIKSTAKIGKNQHHLETGGGFKNFGGLRSREILGCWILCVILNHQKENHESMKICTDSTGGDGITYDTRENHAYLTEHVMVSSWGDSKEDIESLIIKQIDKKLRKGKNYASGKRLVVFINSQV